jgi:superfamily II DNA or RNA helicase
MSSDAAMSPQARGGRTSYYERHRGHVILDEERLAELRPGQRGAVFAMRSWATAPDDGVAILAIPTGYGKSELIALAPFLFGSRKVLVIAPSVVVRNQLAERILAQEHLRRVGIIPSAVPRPRVLEHVGRIESPHDWKQFADYDVVVSHTQSVSPAGKPVVDPPDPDLFDLLLFDEAHHLGAPSWVGVRTAFPSAVAVGFTATPYRRDRRLLPGRTIFQYPIDKAVDEGFFVPITYRQVSADATAQGRDRAVAAEAVAELRRRDSAAGAAAARLLVRADTVKRAEDLAALYQEIDGGVTLEVITHETTKKELEASTRRLRSGESSGVAFVGVLGEGFDLPSLKIAAYHNPHRSLPVTIQFAGRVSRTERADSETAGANGEHAVLIATDDDHPEILAELHRDGQRWDRLIPELAREFGEGPTRAWTIFSPDTADMAAAFTIENFRTFMLADVYRLSSMPNHTILTANLAELHVVTSAPDEMEGMVGAVAPRDSARSVKVLSDGLCYAVLLVRERQLQWLEVTPSGQPEYAYMVLAFEKKQQDGSWWPCVRSTLPPDMTAKAIAQLFGPSLDRPSRAELAQYRGDSWPVARFTGLANERSIPWSPGFSPTRPELAVASIKQSLSTIELSTRLVTRLGSFPPAPADTNPPRSESPWTNAESGRLVTRALPSTRPGRPACAAISKVVSPSASSADCGSQTVHLTQQPNLSPRSSTRSSTSTGTPSTKMEATTSRSRTWSCSP